MGWAPSGTEISAGIRNEPALSIFFFWELGYRFDATIATDQSLQRIILSLIDLCSHYRGFILIILFRKLEKTSFKNRNERNLAWIQHISGSVVDLKRIIIIIFAKVLSRPTCTSIANLLHPTHRHLAHNYRTGLLLNFTNMVETRSRYWQYELVTNCDYNSPRNCAGASSKSNLEIKRSPRIFRLSIRLRIQWIVRPFRLVKPSLSGQTP